MRVLRRNIYSPGAGHQPPLLVGRDAQLTGWELMLDELAFRGRVGARDLILTGPRGVGKTVLMSRFIEAARRAGYETISYQPAVKQAGLVASVVARAAERLDAQAGAWAKVRRSFDNIAGVALGAGGLSATLSLRQAPAHVLTNDPSEVAAGLASLADAVCAEQPTGGVLLAIDELQVAADPDLSLLAVVLQRLNVDHPTARVAFVATALPHIYGVLAAAGVTHPDRLFPSERIPIALPTQEATSAIVTPAMQAGVVWDPAAAAEIVDASNGYPAHLQLMASHTWENAADGTTTLRVADAKTGIRSALASIEVSNFADIWDSLPNAQRRYLHALADLGGEARTAELVDTLQVRSATDLSYLRDELLRRGVIHSPRYGQVALTTPAMAGYITARAVAELNPPEGER